jgi:hypothetical protein
MRQAGVILLLAFLVHSGVGTADEKKPTLPKLAVMPLNAVEVKAGVVKLLTNRLTEEISRLNTYEVISADDLNVMIGVDKMKQMAGCDEMSCVVELAGNIDAGLLVWGTVGKIGSQVKIQLSLFDVRQRKALKRASRSVANNEDLYEGALVAAVQELLGIKAQPAPSAAGVGQEQTIGEQAQEWNPVTAGEQVIVKFASDPPGAVVLLDGKVLCQDTTKGCSKTVAAGAHTVSMQRENYLDRSETIQVKKGMPSVSFKLTPNFGWLTVRSTPSGLPVLINGQASGTTPIERREMAPGAYEVLVQDTCYFAQGKKLSIERDKDSVVDVALKAREGAIDVSASDKDGNAVEAEVFVDGTRAGATPGVLKVSVCAHEVVVKHPDLGSFSQNLNIGERQTAKVTAVLNVSIPTYRVTAGEWEHLSEGVGRDPSMGLMWQLVSRTDFIWYDAGKYCKTLNQAGYSDWRLPDIREMRSLIQGCDKCRNSLQDPCNGCTERAGPIFGCYGPKEFDKPCAWFWSSTPDEADGNYVWLVDFNTGAIQRRDKANIYNTRCVRNEISPDDTRPNTSASPAKQPATTTQSDGKGFIMVVVPGKPGSKVFVNNKEIGQTPGRFEVGTGNQIIKLVTPDGKSMTVNVVVRKGQTIKVVEPL